MRSSMQQLPGPVGALHHHWPASGEIKCCPLQDLQQGRRERALERLHPSDDALPVVQEHADLVLINLI